MEKQTVFRKVSIKDRTPKDYGYYITDVGYIEYSPGHIDEWQYGSPYPSYWLEEVDLPNIIEIGTLSIEYEDSHPFSTTEDGFYDGAIYILNKLK